RESGGALAGLHDLFEQRRAVHLARVGRLQQTDIALNDREKIIELVRNPGGHAANDFHFLRLAKLRLDFQLFGDALNENQQGRDGAERQWFGGQHDLAGGTIGPAESAGFFPQARVVRQRLRVGDGAPQIQVGGGFLQKLRFGIAGEIAEIVVGIDHRAVVAANDRERNGAGLECLREALFARVQFRGALTHHTIQVVHAQFRLAAEGPFLRKRVRHLQNFHRFKRLFENQQIISLPEPLGHLIPRIIRIRRANHRLQFRRGAPDIFQRFNAVPARRHPHVHERQHVRIAIGHRLFHLLECLLPLVGRVDAEPVAFSRDFGGFFITEQRALHVFQVGLRGGFDAENLPEIFVNGRVVVDDEYAWWWSRVWGLTHGDSFAWGGFSGRRRMKVAPLPWPSLWAVSEPPSSLIARALLWRPKPWPLRRVVKPWPKMRVRFSAGMPTPLSMTWIFTWSPPLRPSLIVSNLSVRLDSSSAYFALRIRFTKICSTRCFSVWIIGTVSNSQRNCTSCRVNAAPLIWMASSTSCVGFTVSMTPAT